MKAMIISVVVGLLVFGCTSNSTDSIDQVSGTYVREFSFTVVHPETGLEIGTRTIRDTIFIKLVGDKFEVSNHKWMKNDYNEEGWRNMAHSDDRPLPPYKVVLENDGTLLNPVDDKSGISLYLDLSKGAISNTKNLKRLYMKIP